MGRLHGINSIVLSGYLIGPPVVMAEDQTTFAIVHRLGPDDPPITITVLVEGYRAAWAATLRPGKLVTVQGAILPWAHGTIAIRGDWVQD